MNSNKVHYTTVTLGNVQFRYNPEGRTIQKWWPADGHSELIQFEFPIDARAAMLELASNVATTGKPIWWQ